MEKIADLRIGEYLDILASKTPTPGGGAVAAIVAANSLSLLCMSANFTLGNEKYANFEHAARAVLDEASELLDKLKELSTADVCAFQNYSDISAMKKDTEEEKEKRKIMLQSALIDCMNIPMQIAEYSYRTLELSLKLVNNCNPNLVSDVAVANNLALAALNSAILNVKINLKYIKDDITRDFAEKRLSSFCDRYEKYKKIDDLAHNIMGF